MESIISRKNALVAHIRKLCGSRAYRREKGRFVCDGRKLYEEALASGADIACVLLQKGIRADIPAGADAYEAGPGILEYASRLETPNELLFVCNIPRVSREALRPGRHLVLDGLQDPGNIGTVIRTAEAFSADSVILLPGCADPYNPKAVRATMGAIFRQSFFETDCEGLEAMLLEAGTTLYAAVISEDAADIRTVSLKNAAVAVGSEGSGISEDVINICGGKLMIPMSGKAESLNAAVAAAIILWQGSI